MLRMRNLLSNTAMVLVLLALGVGVALFVSSRAQNSQPAAQVTETTATPAPTAEVKATPTPAATTPPQPPQDDIPEPTWTPYIIIPTGPPPTLPPPPPTPTATPMNPNESEIVAFDVPVGGLAISPDDQTLAVVPLVELADKTLVNQIWMVDLPSKKVEKYDLQGTKPIWSPDGEWILFEVRQGDQFEIKIIGRDYRNEKSLIRFNNKELLGYDWITSEQVNVIGLDGIYQVDLNGRDLGRVNLSLSSKIGDFAVKQAVLGPNEEAIVIDENQDLLITKNDGRTIRISDEKGRSITQFNISWDKKQLAYVVNEGPNDELWINDLLNSSPRKIYRIEMGHIRDVAWMPDNKTVLIGWGETGTDVPTTLLWLDVESGQQTPVGVHGVDQGFIVSHKGDKLFYGRSFSDSANGSYRTTIFQLENKK